MFKTLEYELKVLKEKSKFSLVVENDYFMLFLIYLPLQLIINLKQMII